MLNIWIVNPFDAFPGESLRQGRYSFLAEMLAKRGHRVTWWSSSFHHGTKSFRSQGQASIKVNDNLHIILLETPKYSKNVSLKRIWSHYKYAKALRREAVKASEIPEVIIVTSVPLSAANTAVRLGERFGAKTIIDVQDLWPESFEVIFPRSVWFFARILMFPLRLWAHRVYQEADAISSISETGLRMAISASKKVSKKSMVLPLGVDLELYRACAEKQVGDMPYIKHDRSEFWATYIGTFGKSYDINTILGAATKLAYSHANIKFILAGIGPDYHRMRNLAQRRRLTNVTFTGLLDYKHVVHLLEQSDIGLNAFAPDAKNPLPNKLFDYLAAGLPIVNSLVGEVQDLIETEQVGTQYEAGNAESLAKAIVELYDNPQERLAMEQRARGLAEVRFDMNKEYPKYDEFIRAIVSKSNQRLSQA